MGLPDVNILDVEEELDEAVVAQVDPKVLAEVAKGRLRLKIPRLEEALSGHFGAHHAVVCRQVIDHIDFLDRSIAKLTDEVTARQVPFEAAVSVICSVPGISKTTAEVIVAETGADMSRFASAGQLCAWRAWRRPATSRPASVAPRAPGTARNGCAGISP